jgi:hypothetical protein
MTLPLWWMLWCFALGSLLGVAIAHVRARWLQKRERARLERLIRAVPDLPSDWDADRLHENLRRRR